MKGFDADTICCLLRLARIKAKDILYGVYQGKASVRDHPVKLKAAAASVAGGGSKACLPVLPRRD